MREVRRRLKSERPDVALQAARALPATAVAGSHTAAIYHAQGSELDAWPLAAVLREFGLRVLLPVAVASDAPLVFREARDDAPFAPDAAGVPSPTGGPSMRPDLVFAPLLAFDRFGGRLGQGGGFYDRTLATLRASGPPVTAIGFAYAGQEVDRVPTDAHDARLDGVLTERGLILFNHSGDG